MILKLRSLINVVLCSKIAVIWVHKGFLMNKMLCRYFPLSAARTVLFKYCCQVVINVIKFHILQCFPKKTYTSWRPDLSQIFQQLHVKLKTTVECSKESLAVSVESRETKTSNKDLCGNNKGQNKLNKVSSIMCVFRTHILSNKE